MPDARTFVAILSQSGYIRLTNFGHLRRRAGRSCAVVHYSLPFTHRRGRGLTLAKVLVMRTGWTHATLLGLTLVGTLLQAIAPQPLFSEEETPDSAVAREVSY